MMFSTYTLFSLVVGMVAASEAFIVASTIMGSSRHSAQAMSSVRMSAGSEYVAQLAGAPFSDGVVWDPLGLSDRANPSDIKKWREAEIKHGRVSMLACVGVLVAEVSQHIVTFVYPHSQSY